MYRLTLTQAAERDLARLDRTIEQRVLDKLKELCQSCDNRKHEALKGRYKGQFRFKVTRSYRALYTFNRQTRVLTVSRIQHRSKVY